MRPALSREIDVRKLEGKKTCVSSGLRLAIKKYHKKIVKKLIKKTSGQDSQMDLSTCVLGEGFCLKCALFLFSFFKSLHAPVFFFWDLSTCVDTRRCSVRVSSA